MRNNKLLTIITISVILIMAITAVTVFAIDQSEQDAVIEATVTEKVEELIGNIADSVNNSSEGYGYTASYTDKKLEFKASIDGASGIIDVITLDKIYDVIEAALPVVFVADEVYLNNLEIYDGTINWNGVKSFVYQNMMGFEDFSKLTSKTVFEFNMTLVVYGVEIDVPVALTLDITDSQFEKLKDYAYKASKYVDVYRDNYVYFVRVDATNVYDKLLEDYVLEEGYTVKSARDRLNRLTLRQVAEKLSSVELTGRFERFDDEYQKAIELVEKLINKLDSSKYGTYLDTPVGILDKDNDGVYGDARTVTIPVEKIIKRLEAYAIKYIPEYDGTYDIAAIVGINSVTISYDVEIAVHDSYTATFVDEDGTVLHTTTILEGEIPEFIGRTPEKEATEEYIYTFAGWSDGTNVYTELPELLADTTYTATYDEEPNVCKHPNAQPVEGVEPDCYNPGMTEGVVCPDCGEIVEGCEEIPATGEHIGGEADCCNKAICDICGEEYGDVDSTKHGETEVKDASEAECGDDGYTGDTYCKDCGTMLEQGEIVPATGKHTGGEADCCNKAVCDVCGKEYGDVDSTKHGETEVKDASEADCGNDGYTGDTYCKDCGVMLEKGEVIPATGEHSYGDWVTVTPPTTETEGLKEKTCTVCGDKVEEKIPQTPVQPETGDSAVIITIIATTALVCMAAVLLTFKKRNNVM